MNLNDVTAHLSATSSTRAGSDEPERVHTRTIVRVAMGAAFRASHRSRAGERQT